MSETPTDELQIYEPQASDFARALNSVMDNIENVVVNFQKTLLVILKKIEKLESLEKMSRSGEAAYEKRVHSGEIKQLMRDATTSAKMPRQESSVRHNETVKSIDEGADVQRSDREIPQVVATKIPTDLRESSISKRSTFSGIFSKTFKILSSKSNYLILAIALAVLGIALVEIYFMLFP